jgi:predicted P-loop ATPase
MERTTAEALFLARAEELGGKQLISKIFAAHKKADRSKKLAKVRATNEAIYNSDACPFLTRDNSGKPEVTIQNFKHIMLSDKQYECVRFNELANYPEKHIIDPLTGKLSIERWRDVDEASSKEYIEAQYGIYSDKKHYDALRILFHERSYNPVMDILKTLQWDGEERCEHFLTKWAKADDTPYIHECSRLIFAGGIWRMMRPGCKMDDVVILIGNQGSGKSRLVRFLAVNDAYFGEVKSVDGKEAIEQLDGKWVCEIPELAAFTKQKEVEGVKAFITRQKDNYRKPFDRNVDDRPRRCIFIGTTNVEAPLLDATGGRRFYPVHVRCDGYDLYRHEQECREYILQCWAEALKKFEDGKMPNFAREDLVSEYRKMQSAATQDDWRIGAIESYLAQQPLNTFVCVKQIMTEVLSPDEEHPINPTPKDSKDIGIIMSKMEGWSKSDERQYFEKYGRQRGWRKVSGNEVDVKELPF